MTSENDESPVKTSILPEPNGSSAKMPSKVGNGTSCRFTNFADVYGMYDSDPCNLHNGELGYRPRASQSQNSNGLYSSGLHSSGTNSSRASQSQSPNGLHSIAVSQILASMAPRVDSMKSTRSTWIKSMVGNSLGRGRTRIKLNEKLVLQHRLGEIKRQSRCVLNPESNRFMMGWDLSSAFLLCCLSVLTPLEAGFQKDAEVFSARWIFNQLINLFFFVDLLLQFNLPYTVPTRYGEKLIFSRRDIVIHYLRTWFLVDLVSMIPFDLITPGKSLGALRAVRLLRLLKLLRLLRGIRIVRRIQTEVGVSFRKIMLGQLFMAVVMAAHWIACFLGLVSRWQGEVCLNYAQEDCVVTWMTEGLQATGSSVELVMGAREHFLRTYLTAMHASMSILVHPHHFEPTNIGEQVAFIILMLAGGYIWTQVISRSTAIFTSLDRHRIFFQQTLDDVNSISYSLGLSPALRRRLRKFFLTANRTSNQEVWKGLVSRVSPQLRRDISREVNKAWVLRIHVLSKCQSTSFVTTIAEQLICQQFAEGEIFGSPFHLYVLAGGLGRLVTKIHVLIKDAVWGEDHLLLTNRNLLSDNAAQAMTFLETMTLKQMDFQLALVDFPEFLPIIRKATLKHVLVRGVRLLAEAERKRLACAAELAVSGLPPEAEPTPAEMAKEISQFGIQAFNVQVTRSASSKKLKRGSALAGDDEPEVSGENEYLKDSFDHIRRLRQTSMRSMPAIDKAASYRSEIGSTRMVFPELGDLHHTQLTQSIESLTEQVRLQGETLEKLSIQQETLMAQQMALTSCLQNFLAASPETSCCTSFPSEAALKLPSRQTPRVGWPGQRSRSSPRRSSYSSCNDG